MDITFKTKEQIGDPNLEDTYEYTEQRYAMVHVVAQRAKALQEGHLPLIENTELKPTSQALLEFFTGNVEWKEEEPKAEGTARKAEEKTGPDIQF